MAVGQMLRGKVMRGTCGGIGGDDEEEGGCDACSKRKLNLCDEDADQLSDAALTGTMGKFQRRIK